MDTKGVIYILTNPSFPDYVKIGYANNIQKRLAEELIEIESNSKRKSNPITLSEYLNTKNPEIVDIYQKLQNKVYDTLPKVEMYVLPQYIGWRINGKYFAEIHLQRNKIMMLTLKPNKDYSIGNNVPENFLWTLNYRSYIESINDIEEAQAIILDSYNQRK